MTLLELANMQKDQAGILVTQSLIKYSGFLQKVPFNPSSDGLYDRDNIADNTPAASFRSIGGGVSTVNPKSHVVTTQIFPLTQILTVDSATVEAVGGPRAYLKKHGPQLAEGAGKSMAAQFFYGSQAAGFKGIRDIIISNNNSTTNPIAFKSAATASTLYDTTAIYVVKFHDREFTGLYDGKNFKASGFSLEPLNKGAKVVQTLSDGTERMVYQFGAELYLGLKSLGIKSCAMVYNLKDADTYTPTLALIKKAIRAVKGTASDTVIFANTTGRGLIDDYVKSSVTYYPDSTEGSRQIETIKGIPIMLDDNIVDTEKASEV